MTPLEERIAAATAASGPMTFASYVEHALYEPGLGFFERGGAGRAGGDFLTSPHVGPLFGVLLARKLDLEWERSGHPEPFGFVDAGAGAGPAARSLAAARPRCLDALTVTCVERSEVLRRRHPAGVRSRADLPPGPLDGVVLANELLDNLPFRLAERHGEGWVELGVAWDPGEGRLRWEQMELPPEDLATVQRLAPRAPAGATVPIQAAAAAWVHRALERLGSGCLVVIDYAASTAELARRPRRDWLRTYRAHERGGDVLDSPGTQDVTAEVALDQLPEPDRALTQAAWLDELGIAELVDEGRRVWAERAHLGDIEALRARSRVRESEALTDPAGLGAFTVLEYRR